ncbi:phenylalanine ammonia-lyase [Nemania diffusa]|nr:phenylalanine ammonia-lyase [Nemania diffusa]
MATPVPSCTDRVLSLWRGPSSSTESPLAIDGKSLTIADVVAVSRDLAHVTLTPESIDAIEACSKIIPAKIAGGDVIYGVNTGFGGSADTRSDDVERVQQSLISHLTCGIVADGKQTPVPSSHGLSGHSNSKAHPDTEDPGWKQQHATARASMLIRLNSLAGGASGIRVNVAECLTSLLNADVVPRIPVRGSISASGDLSALAWIGALMQGKPSATAFTGPRDVDGARKVVRADHALVEAGIPPITFHAKEGLAIVNGTAVAAEVAALAAHESLHLAALSQVLTAMSVEALRGSDESFEPFLARVRPHAGQVDSARNIKAFLAGSRLLNRHDSQDVATLRQDRYSLRTASQWLGPVLEDFSLAHEQVTVELNLVTDNLLVDADTGRSLQGISRMLFAQCTELINPATSWGLPPNLCSDAPHDSFLFKGLDVVAASLANPVGSHAQTAGMGNQSLNSLALVSARYTLDAVDVLSQLASAHLLALYQALDLRSIEIEGRQDAPPDATPHLGMASQRIYCFIRQELGIPFLDEGHLASAKPATLDGITPSIGLYNTRVYESIRSGRLYEIVLESLLEVREREQRCDASCNSNGNGKAIDKDVWNS